MEQFSNLNTYVNILTYLISFISYGQINILSTIYVAENAEMHIAVDKTTFNNGGVYTERTTGHYGLLSFASDVDWEGADIDANIDGFIRIYEHQSFVFPSGDQEAFQPAMIERTDERSPVDLAFYNKEHENTDKEFLIEQISPFYWTVYGEHPAILSFSWNTLNNIQALSNNTLDNLSIVGFDGTQWRFIDAAVDESNFYDNSAVTLLSGTISSKNPVNLEGYEAYSLGSVIKKEEMIRVSQGFTPNGDGINDTWYIDGIEKFPDAEITVFNRWGSEVFKSYGNYDNNNGWNGTYKNNSEPLPDGSYMYIIFTNKENSDNMKGWIYITQ